MTSQQIRQQFINFFVQKHGHTFVPSSPVVPHDDPSLLFTNAGMNQFKPIFLGQEKRDYTRAVNSQKCIRAGGKHNDLDDVGRSRRHGTFFEMLGNWSFGDYFKRGAIEMAWELLTGVWKMDPSRLHVTCFEGDEKNGVPRDTEAAALWKQIAGLRDDQIHFFGAKDNFWEMGETGPCGPCTEINIDRRPQAEIDADRAAGRRAPVNGDDPRVMEFWNLVFIQFNRAADRSLTPLPAQHVDTGMGFERICSILQDKQDMYGIDVWNPLFDAISQISGLRYTGLFPATNAPDPVAEAANAQLRHDIAFRVVADHVRCLTFALTDGAVPSNEGRGYVLRRILRRAVRFGRQQLGLIEPFMHKLVPVVVETMGGAFPELKKNPGHVIELIKDEEVSFGRTLDRGIQLFISSAVDAYQREFLKAQKTNPEIQNLTFFGDVGWHTPTEEQDKEEEQLLKEGAVFYRMNSQIRLVSRDDWSKVIYQFAASDIGPAVFKRFDLPAPTISGPSAFKLHDTYGFPIDLTRIMAEERGMSVDIPGYEKLMEQAKEKSRARGGEADFPVTYLPPMAIAQLEREGVPKTDDSPKFAHQKMSAEVVAMWEGVALTSHAAADEYPELAIILNKTPFYAEMGGQTGDTGVLGAPGTQFLVRTTRSVGGYVLHAGRLVSGALKTGSRLVAEVDPISRPRTEANHTTTHVTNWALREVLGDGVQQKGSLVDPEKLRFDFSHGKAVSYDEIEKIESLVIQSIQKNLQVYAEEAPQELALKINGLRAVFGEKYPPMVRVVSIGAPVKDLLANPENEKWRQYSIEFCGGTHLKGTGDAKAFTLMAEESISKGIRRITALTGPAAAAADKAASDTDALLSKAKSTGDDQLAPIIAQLNTTIAAGTLPLRAKRRAQAGLLELQSRVKAFEKSQRAVSNIDVARVSDDLLAKAGAYGPGKLIVADVPGANDEQLRNLMNAMAKKQPSHAVMLASIDGEKVTFVAAVSDDLIKKGLKAGDWIRETAKAAGGGGGGSPKMAQAGGKDPSKINEALDKARAVATAILL